MQSVQIALVTTAVSAMKVIMEMELSALVSVLKNPNLFIAIYSIQFKRHLAFLPIKFFYVQQVDTKCLSGAEQPKFTLHRKRRSKYNPTASCSHHPFCLCCIGSRDNSTDHSVLYQ